MDELEPIEKLLRDELLDGDDLLVVRGWPLTVDGLLRNADATRHRFSRAGEPFSAVSAEVTVGEWTLESILSGPRLRTRSRYAAVSVQALADADFALLPTFLAPTTASPWSPTLLSVPGASSRSSEMSLRTRTTSGGPRDRPSRRDPSR
jgi:hypothetical protein